MDTGSGVLLVGDLSPFGLKSVGIIVSYASLASAMSKVIGASPTSALSEAVTKSTKEQGRDTMMNKNVFTSNGSIWNEL